MQAPVLGEVLSTTADCDYVEEAFFFYVDNESTADDFTGGVLTVGLFQAGSKLLDVSSTCEVVLPNQVNVAIPAASMPSPGGYTVSLFMAINGQNLPLLTYMLEVIAP